MTVCLVISLPKYRIYSVYVHGSGQPYASVTDYLTDVTYTQGEILFTGC